MAKKKPKHVKPIPKANPAPHPTPRPKPPPLGIVRLFRELRDLGLLDDLIERSEVIWTLVGVLPAQVLADLDPAMAKKVIYGTSAKAAQLNAWLLIDPGKRRARLTVACKARSQIVAQEAVKLLDRLLQTTPLLELRKLGLQPNQDPVILEALSRLHQTTTRKRPQRFSAQRSERWGRPLSLSHLEHHVRAGIQRLALNFLRSAFIAN